MKKEGRVGRNHWFGLLVILCVALLGLIPYGLAYEVNEKFSVGGVAAGAYQYQDVKNDRNRGRGAFVFQPEFSYKPADIDEIFAKFGFAAGNGLNDRTRFNLAPWASDMEDDVENIKIPYPLGNV